jgi:hypothetical protein
VQMSSGRIWVCGHCQPAPGAILQIDLPCPVDTHIYRWAREHMYIVGHERRPRQPGLKRAASGPSGQ